jgi:hypothetical protein
MNEMDEVIDDYGLLRRLPKCPYQFYHPLHPGVEGNFPDHEAMGGRVNYPCCEASRSHIYGMNPPKLYCRSVCEAELCPEGWR